MINTRIRAVAAFVFAALAQAGAAQLPGSAWLDGAVITTAGEPLPGAAVELRSIDGGPMRFYSTTTSGDGSFGFRNVPPGRYQLTAMRPGYVRGDYGIHGPGASGITVSVNAGDRLSSLRLAMRRTGTIAGRVMDAIGEGVGNVHVKALRYAYQEGRVALIDVKSVFTNDLGEYRLGWLPPGLYNVSALHPDASVDPLTLPEIINSAFIPGTAVTNPGGMNGGSFQASGTPDPAIRSRLSLDPGMDYVPVYYPGTHDQRMAATIEVRPGSETGGVDLIVAPIRTATLTGTVAPVPAGGERSPVIQVSRNPSYNFRSVGTRIDPQTGAFSISGLAPGAYTVTAAAGSGGQRVTGHATVNVSEGTAASVHVALGRGVDVPVRVRIEGDAPAAALSAIRISLRTDPVVPGIADSPAAQALEDGTLVLAGIAPGGYLVNVAPIMALPRAEPSRPPPAVPGAVSFTAAPPFVPGSGVSPQAGVPAALAPTLQGAYVKSMRFDGAEIDGRLEVGERPPDGPLEIVVGLDPGHVDGVVIGASARPAGHATVVLVPDAARRHRIDAYKVTATDADGRFFVEDAPPGDYTVLAWEDVESWSWLDAQFIRSVEGRGSPVRIEEGDVVPVTVTVIPAR